MGNNIKELRIAFLLTPRELAERMGTYPQQVYRLESSGRNLADEWVEAVAKALGIPKSAVTDPSTDIRAIAAAAAKPNQRTVTVCPIGARFAIQAMVARLGGLQMALDMAEDDLATAVRNLISYVDIEDEDEATERRAIRLSRSLQIVVLAILEAHGVALDQRFLEAVSYAEAGGSSLIQAFSEIGEAGCELIV